MTAGRMHTIGELLPDILEALKPPRKDNPMNNAETTPPAAPAVEPNAPEAGETGALPESAGGIVAALGSLGAGALVFEDGLARLLGKHPISIKRAVDRRELPAPTRLMGKHCWTAGALVRHFEKRLEAAQEAADKILQYRP